MGGAVGLCHSKLDVAWGPSQERLPGVSSKQEGRPRPCEGTVGGAIRLCSLSVEVCEDQLGACACGCERRGTNGLYKFVQACQDQASRCCPDSAEMYSNQSQCQPLCPGCLLCCACLHGRQHMSLLPTNHSSSTSVESTSGVKEQGPSGCL